MAFTRDKVTEIMLEMEMDKGINKNKKESPLLINFPILICMLQHINMKTNIL